jgi:hypothetical protein
MSEAHYLRELEYFMRKTHKTKEHIYFLETCLFEEVLPKFTILPRFTIEKLKLNKQQIFRYRINILIDTLNNHNSDLIFYSQNYQTLSVNFQKTNPDFKKILAIMHSRILKSEFLNDTRRKEKLQKLIKPHYIENEPQIEIFDYSTKKLPANILHILNGVGGYNKKLRFWRNLKLSLVIQKP